MKNIVTALTEIAAKDVSNVLVVPTAQSIARLQQAICEFTKLCPPALTQHQHPVLYQRDAWVSASPVLFVQEATAFFGHVIQESKSAVPKASQVEIVCQNVLDNARNERGELVKLSIRWR